MKIKYKWSMGHPWAEFNDTGKQDSIWDAIIGSKKTDGFPVHLFTENKMVWLRFGCVLFENKKNVLIN